LFKDPKLREYIQYLSLGTEIALGLSLPILFGYWIDTITDSSPWFLLLGIFIGLGLMAGTIIRIIRKQDHH